MSRVSHTTTTAQCDVQNVPLQSCDTNVPIKKPFLLSASINQVFPDDLLQHILSFDDVYRTKSVCKIWRKLSNKNERRNFINLCDEAQKMSPVHFDNQIDQTWIVHPARTKLNATERGLGYQGPVSCILDAIDRCQSGDRILVHDGVYILCHFEIHRGIQIIGIGQNVTVENQYDEDELEYDEDGELLEPNSLVDIDGQAEVFLMNLTLDCSDVPENTNRIGRICIVLGSGFSAHKCKFAFASIGIQVLRDAYLTVTNCAFHGATTAIQISRLAAEVTVNGSTFRHCGLDPANGEHSCIAIDSYTQEVFVSLKCDGNTFQDNVCYPIAETACCDRNTGTVKPRLNLKPSLTNNWLKGYNATQTRAKGVLKDANTLYFNDDM